MLIITDAGQECLQDLLRGADCKNMEIYLAVPKCTGPRLGLVQRAVQGTDIVFEQDGFTLSINALLLFRAKEIIIDCIAGELQVTSAVTYALSSCALCGGCRKQDGYT